MLPFRDDRAKTHRAQQFARQFLIQRIVLNQQHMALQRCGQQGRAPFIKHLADAGVGKRQFGPEGAALSIHAIDADTSAKHGGQIATDRQSQAGATVAPGNRRIRLHEGLEQAGTLLVGQSDASR